MKIFLAILALVAFVSGIIVMLGGKSVRARVQRPGDPRSIRDEYWPAHGRITVERSGAKG